MHGNTFLLKCIDCPQPHQPQPLQTTVKSDRTMPDKRCLSQVFPLPACCWKEVAEGTAFLDDEFGTRPRWKPVSTDHPGQVDLRNMCPTCVSRQCRVWQNFEPLVPVSSAPIQLKATKPSKPV